MPELKPRWVGQFNTYDDWLNNATQYLAGRKGSVGQDVPAICVDTLGRRCHVGKDFMRARDEGTFPVRYFWDCEADSYTCGVCKTTDRTLHMTCHRPICPDGRDQ